MPSDFDTSDCYTIPGKLALPYTYFAGRVGSRFITTLRDRHKIMGVRCDHCDMVFVPPRQACERCLRDLSDQWCEVGTRGQVENYTVVRYPDRHQPRPVPFVLAMIRLDGADTPIVHLLEEIAPEQVVIGMAVEAVFAETTTATIRDIDHFKPCDS